MLEQKRLLSKEDVRNWCNDPIHFYRGLLYYEQNRVIELSSNQNLKRWIGFVQGSRRRPYEVYVEVEEQLDELTAECDCPQYNNAGECKHCVAVMLAMTSVLEKEVRKPAADLFSTPAAELIQTFERLTDVNGEAKINQQPLKVEFHLHKVWENHDPFLQLECKVGPGRRAYVVKEIGNFLIHAHQKQPLKFNQSFTYHPEEHAFLPQDQEVFSVLRNLYLDRAFYRILETDYINEKQLDSRYLLIPPAAADELLNKLQHCQVFFDGKEGIETKEESLPFHFRVQEEESGRYELAIDLPRDIFYFPVYSYYYHDGVFYKASPEQERILEAFFQTSQLDTRKNTLPLEREEMNAVVTHVLPELKKVASVKISETVSQKIVAPSLSPRVYLDLEGDWLTLKVEYHYDEYVIDPFIGESTDEEHDVILKRDARKEREIMAIIEQAPLKYNGNVCYAEGEEAFFEVLYEVIPLLEEKANIYLTDRVRRLMLAPEKRPSMNIDVSESGDLLEIGFEMGDIEPAEVEKVLRAAVEKKKFYRLPNGAFVPLTGRELEPFMNLVEAKILEGQSMTTQMKVPVHHSFQIKDVANQKGVHFGKKFRRLLAELKNPENKHFPLPSGLRAELREYQQTGFQWFKTLAHYRLGGILADDMGLGKTLQSIAYLLSEHENQRDSHPSLVVVPASLVYNWKREFDKFAPDLRVGVAYGTPEERQAVLDEKGWDVILTSYPLVRQDQKQIQKRTFASLILDEAQAIKNHQTKTARAVKKIHAQKRFALSGTPIENALEELWSIFDTILPGLFRDEEAFRRLETETIAARVRPFILRRVKSDVLKELPEKIETVHYTDLTKSQKQYYLGYLEKIRTEARDSIASEGFDKSRMKILAGLTRLRQICCHPALFLENYHGKSGKLEQLLETIGTARQNGRRLLIFSQFTSMLQIIRQRLEQTGFTCFYLDGKTPSRQRLEMCERFNHGEKDLFLISLRAGGTGLNLTGADTVILYDLWWNPAVEDQAADRAHRIGQKNVVQVMRFIAKGTIEEKIYQLQQRKKALIASVVQPGETLLSKMSEEEIREILEL